MYNNSDEVYNGTCCDSPHEIKTEKKIVSRVFIALTLSGILAYSGVILLSILLVYKAPHLAASTFVQLLLNDLYTVVAIALFALITCRIKNIAPTPSQKMTAVKFLMFVIVSVFLMFTGSLAGTLISEILGTIINRNITNAVADVVSQYPIWEVFLSVVIIAPITEELLFRKLLIDKISRYGTTFSIIFSGVVFGAFHGNFYQLFYGAAMGMLLAYIYCMFGKVRYTIILHSIVNFLGSVVSLYMADFIESPHIAKKLIATIYTLGQMGCVVAGVFIVIMGIKKYMIYKMNGVLVAPARTLAGNVGMIIYSVYILILFAINIFS